MLPRQGVMRLCDMRAPLEKIVSGGQTGVDRAALDVALELGIGCGGWCPKGRRAEDGRIPRRYPMRETPGQTYETRTRLNVDDSDATLVLTHSQPTGGTALTIDIARELGRPLLVADPIDPAANETVVQWLVANHVTLLNVAGPRESTEPGIYRQAAAFLKRLLSAKRYSKSRADGLIGDDAFAYKTNR